MITAIKILLTLAIVLLMSYPFITAKGSLRKLFVASSLKYHAPHNRKNLYFVILAVLHFIVIALLFNVFYWFTSFVYALPLIGSLISKAVQSLGSHVDYVLFAIRIVIVNFLVIYTFLFLKAIVKKLIPLVPSGRSSY